MRYHWKASKSYTKGRVGSLRSIMLHSTDGRKTGDIETLTEGDVSVHWYITRSGEVWHFVNDSDTAFHAGAVVDTRYSNAASIGIELEHFDGKEGWPDLQVNAAAILVKSLWKKHGKLGLVSHAHAASPPGRKQDPVAFPWSAFYALIQEVKAEELLPAKAN